MKKTIITCIFSFIILSLLIGADEGPDMSCAIDNNNITGRVLYNDTPVEGATVTISPGTGTALTDASGNYTIESVPVGMYMLTATKEPNPKGSIIVFPSYVLHQVKPVTAGLRYSLVVWTLGYPFR